MKADKEGLLFLSPLAESRYQRPGMKSLVVFLAVVAMGTPAAIQYPEEWHLWKAEHGVSYSVSHGVTFFTPEHIEQLYPRAFRAK